MSMHLQWYIGVLNLFQTNTNKQTTAYNIPSRCSHRPGPVRISILHFPKKKLVINLEKKDAEFGISGKMVHASFKESF